MSSPALLWTKQLLALAGKESKQILRDPSSYLVAFVLPMIFLLLFGYGITLDAGIMDIVVLDQSDSAAGMQLRTDFAHSPSFRVHAAFSRKEAEQLMRDSVISGFIVLPSNFEALLEGKQGASVPVQVIVSGSEPNTANFIRGYSQGVIGNWARNRQGRDVHEPLEVLPRYWFNPAAQSRWYLVPGSITVIMTLIGTLLTALVIAREYERGTMEALFATPVSRMQILLGKLIPYYVLGMLSMTICALAGVFLFQVPLRGSIGALVLLSSAFLMPALGQGLLISILTKEQLLAAQTGLITGFLPAIILSGFIFDSSSMPVPLQYLTLLIPARHFNVALQTVFLAGDIWAIFWPGIMYMLGLGSFFLVVTYRRLIKRLDA